MATRRKIEITTKTFRCTAEVPGQWLTAGETYTAEFRSNSRDVHFVRRAGAGMSELEMIAARHAEIDADIAEHTANGDSFAAYWAGSASSSVLRDFAAGRTIKAKTRRKPIRLIRVVR